MRRETIKCSKVAQKEKSKMQGKQAEEIAVLESNRGKEKENSYSRDEVKQKTQQWMKKPGKECKKRRQRARSLENIIKERNKNKE